MSRGHRGAPGSHRRGELETADEADRRVARGEPLGRAHGLPVVVKDVMKVAGPACSGGSSAVRSVARADERPRNGPRRRVEQQSLRPNQQPLRSVEDARGQYSPTGHNTGIAGFKPTHGRIPRTGSVFGDALGVFGPFNCYGPLARTVEDLYLGPLCGTRAAGKHG